MKSLLMFVGILISLSSFSQSSDVMAIQRMLDKQTEAWNRGDLENFMVGYWNNDSLMFIGKSGVTYGYKNTLANYKKGYPDKTAMGKLESKLIHVNRISKNYYHVTGKWKLTRTIGDVSGHYTLLLRKIRGNWVIVLDHSS